RARQEVPSGVDHPRMRRADDGADRGEAARTDEVLAPGVDQLRDVVPERSPVRQREVLDVAAARVRRLEQAEDSRAVVAAGADKRLDGIASHVRAHGDYVGERGLRPAWLEERGRVSLRRRGDVAALDVPDDEQPGCAGVVADSLEDRDAFRPERLEEGGLGLDGDGDL